MDAIKTAAFISVGRACGFAGLGILCLMLGLSFEPVMATRAGGVLGLGLAAILAVLGRFAPRRSYQETETWLILPKADRPPPTIAQRMVGETLRETYLWFAERAVVGSIILLAASLLLKLLHWMA
ncbi:MAG: hypothetical protein ACR2QF_16745 [Geminicoccaceae bacterium]